MQEAQHHPRKERKNEKEWERVIFECKQHRPQWWRSSPATKRPAPERTPSKVHGQGLIGWMTSRRGDLQSANEKGKSGMDGEEGDGWLPVRCPTRRFAPCARILLGISLWHRLYEMTYCTQCRHFLLKLIRIEMTFAFRVSTVARVMSTASDKKWKGYAKFKNTRQV